MLHIRLNYKIYAFYTIKKMIFSEKVSIFLLFQKFPLFPKL